MKLATISTSFLLTKAWEGGGDVLEMSQEVIITPLCKTTDHRPL